MRKGFTLVEIMIVVAIIALLAAIAIPNLMRARLQANESASQAALKTIATAEITYRSGNVAYGTLTQLGNASPPYLDSQIGCASPPCQKSGYNFTLTSGTDLFVANAIPTTANVSGVRHFCITEDGVVRVDAAITASTNHDTCQGYSATTP